MRFLNRLEARLGRYAIPNVTLWLVFGQSLLYVMAQAKPAFLNSIWLIPERVMAGEFWRLATFIFFPPATNPVFALFILMFLYFMGTSLENQWGTFRYNLYLLIAVVMQIAAAFLTAWMSPIIGVSMPTTSTYLDTSVFLAFAFLFPEYPIYLFFIIPVKAKWLAMVTWVLYGVQMITGPWLARLLVLASVANFLLFFWKDLLDKAKTGRRMLRAETKKMLVDRDKPFHVCAACGITDKTHPKMDFRYCPQCSGGKGYCEAHINNHEHK